MLNVLSSTVVSYSNEHVKHTVEENMKRSVVVVLFLMCSMCMGAFAQDKTPVVDQREKNQQERIKEGVKSGELTPAETRRLEMQQGKIKADELNAKSDGVVTPKERSKLKYEQNRTSRNIHRKKHNAKVCSK
jgi:hypothetical protein